MTAWAAVILGGGSAGLCAGESRGRPGSRPERAPETQYPRPPTGVCAVSLRHGLRTVRLRLAALEKESAEEGLVLTQTQVAALERKREDEQQIGEIETAHPGDTWAHRTRCTSGT